MSSGYQPLTELKWEIKCVRNNNSALVTMRCETGYERVSVFCPMCGKRTYVDLGNKVIGTLHTFTPLAIEVKDVKGPPSRP